MLKHKQDVKKREKRIKQYERVLSLMETGVTREVNGEFISGATTRVLSGTIYAHKPLTLATFPL